MLAACYSALDLAEETTHPQVVKTRSVREWVLRFVGGGPGPKAKAKGNRVEALREMLPPDTQ